MRRKNISSNFMRLAMLLAILRNNIYYDFEYELEYELEHYEHPLSDRTFGDLLLISPNEFHRNDNQTFLLSLKEDPINDTISRLLSRPAIRPSVRTESIQAYLTGVTDTIQNNITHNSTIQPSNSTELTKQDMELIDILWRQDMDMGVCRKTLESTLTHPDGIDPLEEKISKSSKSAAEENEIRKQLLQSKEEDIASLNVTYRYDEETGERFVNEELQPANDSKKQNDTEFQFTMGEELLAYVDVDGGTLFSPDSSALPLTEDYGSLDPADRRPSNSDDSSSSSDGLDGDNPITRSLLMSEVNDKSPHESSLAQVASTLQLNHTYSAPPPPSTFDPSFTAPVADPLGGADVPPQTEIIQQQQQQASDVNVDFNPISEELLQFDDINMSDLIYYCENNASDDAINAIPPANSSQLPSSNQVLPCTVNQPSSPSSSSSNTTSSPSFDFAAALADVPPSFDMAASLGHSPLTCGSNSSSAADFGPLSFDFSPFPSEEFFAEIPRDSSSSSATGVVDDYDLSDYDLATTYDLAMDDLNVAGPISSIATSTPPTKPPTTFPTMCDPVDREFSSMRQTYENQCTSAIDEQLRSFRDVQSNAVSVPQASLHGSPNNKLGEDNFLFDEMFETPDPSCPPAMNPYLNYLNDLDSHRNSTSQQDTDDANYFSDFLNSNYEIYGDQISNEARDCKLAPAQVLNREEVADGAPLNSLVDNSLLSQNHTYNLPHIITVNQSANAAFLNEKENNQKEQQKQSRSSRQPTLISDLESLQNVSTDVYLPEAMYTPAILDADTCDLHAEPSLELQTADPTDEPNVEPDRRATTPNIAAKSKRNKKQNRQKKADRKSYNVAPALGEHNNNNAGSSSTDGMITPPRIRIKRRPNFVEGVHLSNTDIVETRVDAFNQLISQEKLSEEELARMRDIRKRGKNKIAAMNCRKRKVDFIDNLVHIVDDLKEKRDDLLSRDRMLSFEKEMLKKRIDSIKSSLSQVTSSTGVSFGEASIKVEGGNGGGSSSRASGISNVYSERNSAMIASRCSLDNIVYQPASKKPHLEGKKKSGKINRR